MSDSEAPPSATTPSKEEEPKTAPAFGFGAAAAGAPFGGFGAAAAAGGNPFGAAAAGTGFSFGTATPFGAPPPAADASGDNDGDDAAAAQEECKAEFAPVIALPDEVETVTGEEEEATIYEIKAKLYRYDTEKAEWKERGLGVMKILEHKVTKKTRLLMRREKTLKICCNQVVQSHVEMKEHPANDKSWVWTAADFSDGENKTELLCIRFGNTEKANAFKDAYLMSQAKLPRGDDKEGSDDEDAEEGPQAPESDEEEGEATEESAKAAEDLAAGLEKANVDA
jgi:Ran-binding protein 1